MSNLIEQIEIRFCRDAGPLGMPCVDREMRTELE